MYLKIVKSRQDTNLCTICQEGAAPVTAPPLHEVWQVLHQPGPVVPRHIGHRAVVTARQHHRVSVRYQAGAPGYIVNNLSNIYIYVQTEKENL